VVVVNWSYVLGACALVCVLLSGIAAAEITRVLSSRDIEVNPRDFTWLRRSVLGHLKKYKTMTRGETGQIGLSYFLYIGSILGAFLFVAGALTVRFA
jgi:hypothetical protein